MYLGRESRREVSKGVVVGRKDKEWELWKEMLGDKRGSMFGERK